METSFVVSAAFWAPVATEYQNDMAFLVAINVETEMVSFARVLSDFERRNNEEAEGTRGSTLRREGLPFSTSRKKEGLKRESAPREVIRCTRTLYH